MFDMRVKTLFLVSLCFSLAWGDLVLPQVTLVSGARGYLLHIQPVPTGVEVNYEQKGSDFIVTLSSTGILDVADFSVEESFDKAYPLSVMAVRIHDGELQILLKNYQLSTDQIVVKRNKNELFVFLDDTQGMELATVVDVASFSSSGVAVGVETSVSTSVQQAIELDSITVLTRDSYASVYLHGEDLCSSFTTTIVDTGFFLQSRVPLSRTDSLNSIYSLDSAGAFTSLVFEDSSVFVGLSREGVLPILFRPTATGVVFLCKDNRVKTTPSIVVEGYPSNVTTVLVFDPLPKDDYQLDGGDKEVVELLDTTSQEIAELEKITEQILFVIKDKVNLRENPSKSSRQLGQYPYGTRLLGQGKEGQWFSILTEDGLQAWIFETLVEDSITMTSDQWDAIANRDRSEENLIDGDATFQEIVELEKITEQVLFVIKDKVNLRENPSKSSKQLGQYPYGTRLLSFEKKGQWFSVMTKDGMSAWVFETLVEDSIMMTSDQWDAIANRDVSEENIVDEFVDNTQQIETDGSSKFSVATLAVNTPAVNIEDSTEIEQESPVVKVAYEKYGRDPFLPLDKSTFVRANLPNVHAMTLVGILYDSTDAVALFEEEKNNEIVSFSLREKDSVINGTLWRIEENKVVFLMNESDFSYTTEKELKAKQE